MSLLQHKTDWWKSNQLAPFFQTENRLSTNKIQSGTKPWTIQNCWKQLWCSKIRSKLPKKQFLGPQFEKSPRKCNFLVKKWTRNTRPDGAVGSFFAKKVLLQQFQNYKKQNTKHHTTVLETILGPKNISKTTERAGFRTTFRKTIVKTTFFGNLWTINAQWNYVGFFPPLKRPQHHCKT